MVVSLFVDFLSPTEHYEIEKMIAVPSEASAFLGAVGALLVVLVIFYLYLSKKLCFTTIGGFPCCNQPVVERREQASKDLVSVEIENGKQPFQQKELLSSMKKWILPLTVKMKCCKDFSSHLVCTMACVRAWVMVTMARMMMMNNTILTASYLTGRRIIGGVGKSGSIPSSSSEASDEDTRDDRQAVMQPLLDNQSQTQHFENSAFQTTDISPVASNDTFSACGDSATDDQMFDATDLRSNTEGVEASNVTRCGSLEVGFAYDVPSRKMTVDVLQARDLPARERGGGNHVQVRLLLLPHKRQKFKTKIRHGEKPQFNESFSFSRIIPEEITSMGIRFRLNGCERMRREHLIGECVVPFTSIRLDQQTTLWLTLEPRSNIAHSDSRADITSLARSDSTGSTQSMQHGGLPELLLGLAYNGTTGRLSAEVNKGSHFRNVSMNRAPDTYVKLSLVSSNGQEIARSKTSVRRGQPNPLFKETFVFQVALFQLPDVTLMISVYNKRSMKRKEMIGWFSLGLNSSGEEELAHWNDMRENRGEQICRWHVLLET